MLVVGRHKDQGRQRGTAGAGMLRQGLCHLDAAHARHPDVQEGNVGLEGLDQLHGLKAMAGFTQDLERRPHLLQGLAQLLAHQAFVIGDQGGAGGQRRDLNRHVRTLS